MKNFINIIKCISVVALIQICYCSDHREISKQNNPYEFFKMSLPDQELDKQQQKRTEWKNQDYFGLTHEDEFLKAMKSWMLKQLDSMADAGVDEDSESTEIYKKENSHPQSSEESYSKYQSSDRSSELDKVYSVFGRDSSEEDRKSEIYKSYPQLVDKDSSEAYQIPDNTNTENYDDNLLLKLLDEKSSGQSERTDNVNTENYEDDFHVELLDGNSSEESQSSEQMSPTINLGLDAFIDVTTRTIPAHDETSSFAEDMTEYYDLYNDYYDDFDRK